MRISSRKSQTSEQVMGEGSQTIRQLLDEDILWSVTRSVHADEIIHLGAEVARLTRSYPGSGLKPHEIGSAVINAAIAARRCIEI